MLGIPKQGNELRNFRGWFGHFCTRKRHGTYDNKLKQREWVGGLKTNTCETEYVYISSDVEDFHGGNTELDANKMPITKKMENKIL